MTEHQALARWRQWARDVSGESICPIERQSDDDLRAAVICEQERRTVVMLKALNLRGTITEGKPDA